jgi:hypothetical protein
MKFIRGLFLDEDGKPSSSRVLSYILAAFVCGWVSAEFHYTHRIPDQGTLIGLTAFMLSPYSVNSLRNGFGSPKVGNDDGGRDHDKDRDAH